MSNRFGLIEGSIALRFDRGLLGRSVNIVDITSVISLGWFLGVYDPFPVHDEFVGDLAAPSNICGTFKTISFLLQVR